jgi:hypothetical protein
MIKRLARMFEPRGLRETAETLESENSRLREEIVRKDKSIAVMWNLIRALRDANADAERKISGS